MRSSLIRTRNPGASIVEEAERRNADVVYMSTVHAPPSESSLGPTASYLLEKRPCRIVIETDGGAMNGRAPVNGRRRGYDSAATASRGSPSRA